MTKPWEKYQGAAPAPEANAPWARYGAVPGSVAARPPVEAAPIDLAEDMPWYEKALVGAGGGLRNAYLGGKSLVGLGSEEEAQERKDWAKNKEDLGGWGTAGEIVGESALTAIPGMGVAGAAGKVLSKALPALTKAGPAGGRVLNRALAGRAATEGAVSAGVVGDVDDKTLADRLDNVALGGTIGAVIPGVIAGTGAAGRGVKDFVGTEIMPTTGAAKRRAANALERTLGPERLQAVANQVDNPVPSMLPRTTAAASADPRMGALERGARGRGNADFASHDRQVAEKAWEAVQAATKSADELPTLAPQPGQIMQEGKAIMDQVRLPQVDRTNLSQGLLQLRNTNEVIANPDLAKTIDQAIAALDNPEATAGLLPQLYMTLGDQAGQSTAIQQARDMIKHAADQRMGGQFTNTLEGYGGAMDAVKSAEAAKKVRNTFVSDEGLPLTAQTFGDLPAIQSKVLRKALAKHGEAAGVVPGAPKANILDPTERSGLEALADSLRQHEINLPQNSLGGGGINLGAGEGAGSAALNAGPLWRLRGVLGSVFEGLNESALKQVDEALLNPDAFQALIAKKVASNVPLTPGEQAAAKAIEIAKKQALLTSVRSAGASSGEE